MKTVSQLLFDLNPYRVIRLNFNQSLWIITIITCLVLHSAGLHYKVLHGIASSNK